MIGIHPSPVVLLLVAPFLAVMTGCGGPPSHTSGPSFARTSNVYVRNAFDTDPSIYLGRFVPRGAADLDESSAMPLGCSRFITHRFVEGGGVKMTETMQVSSELALRLGLPGVASIGGARTSNREVRVEYTLLGKVIAEPTDHDAFAQCCEERPDQCTDRYIGEFLQGTGVVYRGDARSRSANVEGAHGGTGLKGEAGASDGHRWSQLIEFPNPVYFAFKVTPTTQRRSTSSCGRWVDSPPTEEGHVFFVGTSSASRTEEGAREEALRKAQERAYVSAADVRSNEYGYEDDPNALRWALGMQVVHSCVEPQGDRFVGRVLGRLPRYGTTGD